MKTLPLGISTFEDYIDGDFLYVDKTEYLYQLVKPAKTVYFLSRPRRFGKSLTLSTLKAIFQGKKELFKGLAIYDKEYDWDTYPVIHIDLGDKQASSADELREVLDYVVSKLARDHDIQLDAKLYFLKFQELIEKLSATNKVVILIDEYDKPILGNIKNVEECEKIRDVLKAFYSVIKSADPYLRFVLLTGVSKFSKVSVFSDLNNLQDLTMDAEFAALCGYTQEELEYYFNESIEAIAVLESTSKEVCLDKIKRWYNGYRFSEDSLTVYNPVSTMNLCKSKKFQNHWFETGTPTFLIDLIKKSQFDLETMEFEYEDEQAFSTYEINNLQVLPLMFQTGYLTIQDFRVADEFREFKLGFPNFEVEEAFNKRILESYTTIETGRVSWRLRKLITALRENDLDEFFQTLKIFFAGIDYDLHLKNEKYYQTIFYVIFKVLGLRIDAEVKTNAGRIDTVIKINGRVFIFEFKLFDTAASALEQIKEKNYAEKYRDSGQEIVLIGAAFSPETKNVDDWVVDRLN